LPVQTRNAEIRAHVPSRLVDRARASAAAAASRKDRSEKSIWTGFAAEIICFAEGHKVS